MMIVVSYFFLLVISTVVAEVLKPLQPAYENLRHIYPIMNAIEFHPETLPDSVPATTSGSDAPHAKNSYYNGGTHSNQLYVSENWNNPNQRRHLRGGHDQHHHSDQGFRTGYHPLNRNFKSHHSPKGHTRQYNLNKLRGSVGKGGRPLQGRRYWLGVEDFIQLPHRKHPQSHWFFYPIMTDNLLQPLYYHSHVHSHVAPQYASSNHVKIDTVKGSVSNKKKHKGTSQDNNGVEHKTSTAESPDSEDGQKHWLGHAYNSLGGDHFTPKHQPFPEYILGTILRIDSNKQNNETSDTNPYQYDKAVLTNDNVAGGTYRPPLRHQLYTNAVPSYMQVVPNYQGYDLGNVKSQISVIKASTERNMAAQRQQVSTTTKKPTVSKKRQQSGKSSTSSPTHQSTTVQSFVRNKQEESHLSHGVNSYTKRPSGYLPDYLPGHFSVPIIGQLPGHSHDSESSIESPVRGRIIHIRS